MTNQTILDADVSQPDDDEETRLERELLEHTMPACATGLTDQWTTIGAQLCTTDGRCAGHGVVTGTGESNGHTVYVVVTDVGTQLRLTEQELKEMFHQPRFTMNVETHPGVLRRAGADAVHRWSGLTADDLWWQTGELRSKVANLEDDKKKAEKAVQEISNADLDLHLDAILRAAGSALKHYTMAKSKDDMRNALRKAIRAPIAAQA